MSIAGFSEPSDADVDDIELWYPRFPTTSPAIDLEMARYVMANLGDRFCELVEQEKEAMMWVSADSKIVWKRAVQGVREMCDVCDTTLFNMHWCCHKCGFVVCIDCYRNKAKKTGSNQVSWKRPMNCKTILSKNAWCKSGVFAERVGSVAQGGISRKLIPRSHTPWVGVFPRKCQ